MAKQNQQNQSEPTVGRMKTAARRSSQAVPVPSTPNTPPKSSAATKATTTKSAASPSQKSQPKGSAPVTAITVSSPAPQRNISDPSYKENSAPRSRTSATSRIGEQMVEAQTLPDRPLKSHGNIEARKKARQKLIDRGPKHGLNQLNTRTESGASAAFAAGHNINHKRDAQGRQNQEPNRMMRLTPNMRPSQRVHPK